MQLIELQALILQAPLNIFNCLHYQLSLCVLVNRLLFRGRCGGEGMLVCGFFSVLARLSLFSQHLDFLQQRFFWKL